MRVKNTKYGAVEMAHDLDPATLLEVMEEYKDKKAFLLLSNLLLASFQKRIADKFAIKPGQEMIKAIETGKAVSARIIPADREIQITLSRTWRLMGFIDKIKILIQLVFSVGDIGDISEADIEKMKEMKEHIKVLIIVDKANNDIDNPYMLLWRVVNNIDAQRDILLDPFIVIDATAKSELDGYDREWPGDTLCDEAVLKGLQEKGLIEIDEAFIKKFGLLNF